MLGVSPCSGVCLHVSELLLGDSPRSGYVWTWASCCSGLFRTCVCVNLVGCCSEILHAWVFTVKGCRIWVPICEPGALVPVRCFAVTNLKSGCKIYGISTSRWLTVKFTFVHYWLVKAFTKPSKHWRKHCTLFCAVLSLTSWWVHIMWHPLFMVNSHCLKNKYRPLYINCFVRTSAQTRL